MLYGFFVLRTSLDKNEIWMKTHYELLVGQQSWFQQVYTAEIVGNGGSNILL